MEKERKSGLGDKRRLIILIAILLSLGFVGTSMFAFFAARSAIRATIERDALPVAAESVYARLQKDLVQPLFVSSMMANDTFLHDWVNSGESDTGKIIEYLALVQSRYKAFTAFFVSERSSRYYYPGGILKKVSPSEPRDEWYFRVRSMAEPYELNIDPDLAHADALTVFINYRVIDSKGNYLGAAGVGLSVSAMTQMAETLRSEYKTAVYFVEPSGKIVAGLPEGLEQVPESVFSDRSLSSTAEKAIAAGGGSFLYQRANEIVHLHVLWLPEVKWFLFVERGETESMEGSRRALSLNLAICGLIIALALVSITWTVNRYQSRLERTASYDFLTGVMNRISFGLLSEAAVKDSRRSGRALSIILLDVDDFKRVNDEFGHLAGDRTLKLLAEEGKAALRESDALCRWGGEEFLILLADTELPGATLAAEKFRAAAAEATEKAGPFRLTLSAGVASLEPGEDFQALVRRADNGLLEAKRLGKNRVVVGG